MLSIIGASVRAAAHSAMRAGHTVWGGDLFADEDLKAVAEAHTIQRYPTEFLALLPASPNSPWMYTGALENYPHLLQRLANIRPLLGNPANVVRQARNPFLLGKELQTAGIPFPETRHVEWPLKEEIHAFPERWLFKPRRSGGGQKICFLAGRKDSIVDSRQTKHGLLQRGFLQRYVAGQACSAVYVGAKGDAVLLGLTIQHLGQPNTNSHSFAYCGSSGPVSLRAAQRAELTHIGRTLANRFQLAGLFGVDLIQSTFENSPAPEFTFIEVNPRYTASVELLERAYEIPTIAWHVAACIQGELPLEKELAELRADAWRIKKILYARAETTFHPQVAAYVRANQGHSAWPRFADIPAEGTTIKPGSPILTIFSSGNNSTEAGKLEESLVSEFEKRLYGDTPSIEPGR